MTNGQFLVSQEMQEQYFNVYRKISQVQVGSNLVGIKYQTLIVVWWWNRQIFQCLFSIYDQHQQSAVQQRTTLGYGRKRRYYLHVNTTQWTFSFTNPIFTYKETLFIWPTYISKYNIYKEHSEGRGICGFFWYFFLSIKNVLLLPSQWVTWQPLLIK